jgi:hypothetical protein
MGEQTAAASRFKLDRLLSGHLHTDGLLGPEVHFWDGSVQGASVRLQWAEWLAYLRLHIDELEVQARKARSTKGENDG